MKKAAELRQALLDALPELHRAPDRLLTFIEKGAIACRAGSLAFQYSYDLKIVVTDYADHADTLIIPIVAWISKNQPELLQNPEKFDKVIAFQAEIIDHEKTDVELTIPITERVIVAANEGGGYTSTHCGEPDLEDLTGPSPWSIVLGGMLLVQTDDGDELVPDPV